MAYDPALTSLIAVAVVGGMAAVMNISSEWELAHELSRETERWTRLAVTRRYPASSPADRQPREAEILRAHGYEADAPEPAGPPAHGQVVRYRRSRTA